MNEAEHFSQVIVGKIGSLKSGSLRIWGSWFGRPRDNVHRIVHSSSEADVLRIHFDNNELLSVWSPANLVAEDSVFRISDAARVRWEWYYYGRSQTPENQFFMDYVRGQNGASNASWYRQTLRTDASFPAVELL